MIQYCDSIEGICADQLEGFFVGWPRRPSADTLLAILQGSAHVFLAFHNGQCVGFVNAVSDGCFSAFIPLLEVLPEYQGQGIGSELIQRMVARLESHYSIDLVCDPERETFYVDRGFQPLRGMARRNPHRIR